MVDYFEEMSWTPLGDGEAPDGLLDFARLIRDMGLDTVEDWPRLPPPASKLAVTKLLSKLITVDNQNCPICLKTHAIGETVKIMPCQHEFHPDCLLPWLEKTNSCPLCRHELPTDNPDYENFKKEKKRAKQRELEIEELHNSMFS